MNWSAKNKTSEMSTPHFVRFLALRFLFLVTALLSWQFLLNPVIAESETTGKSRDSQGNQGNHRSAKVKNSGSEKQSKASKQTGEKDDKAFSVPIPIGHGAKGIRLPYYDGEGVLQMFFNIGDAFRVDERHLSMKELIIETYDPRGKPALSIKMGESVLDLKTRIVQSDEEVKIRGGDFEVTGNHVVFNTVSRQGTLTGPTRTLLLSPAFGVKPPKSSALQPDKTVFMPNASTPKIGENVQ